jgi:uncharacterized membrane protein
MKQQIKTTTTTTKTIKPSAKPVGGIGTMFDKGNLMWMLIGLVVMAVGFLLMVGGRSSDPNVFNANEVYGTRRITIAPIIILAGLVIEIVAIFRRPKNSEV